MSWRGIAGLALSGGTTAGHLCKQVIERVCDCCRTIGIADILSRVVLPPPCLHDAAERRRDRGWTVVGHVGNAPLDFGLEMSRRGRNDMRTGSQVLDYLKGKKIALGVACFLCVDADLRRTEEAHEFVPRHKSVKHNSR